MGGSNVSAGMTKTYFYPDCHSCLLSSLPDYLSPSTSLNFLYASTSQGWFLRYETKELLLIYCSFGP